MRSMVPSTLDRPAPQRNGHTEYRIGRRLPDSKMKGRPFRNYEECDHPPDQQQDRGNSHQLWRTCRLCHARWERLPVLEPIMDGRTAEMAAAARQMAQEEERRAQVRSQSSDMYDPVTLTSPVCPEHHISMIPCRNLSNGGLYWKCPENDCLETHEITLEGQQLVARTPAMDLTDQDHL